MISPQVQAGAASTRTEQEVRTERRLSMMDVIRAGVPQPTTFAARILVTSRELKGCPWCGSEPAVDRDKYGKHVVFCENDDCPSGAQINGSSLDETIKLWNGRAA